MIFSNTDLVLSICKFLTLSDIEEFQLVDKNISDILITNKEYILRDECHTPIIPHGVVIENISNIYIETWYKEGRIHRDGDLPAKIHANDDKEWWQNNELHRDGDLPAKICSNGDKEWWQHNELHRDGDLPAIIRGNNDCEWYQNNKLSRKRKPSRIEYYK